MTDDRFILKPVAWQWGFRVALLLYLVSFVLPVEIATAPPRAFGFSLFFLGMIYCWIPVCFPWWANVFFWVALGRSAEKPTLSAFLTAVAAFVLAGSFFFIAGPSWEMLGPAYCAWTGSMGVLMVGLGVSLVRFDQRRIEDDSEERARFRYELDDERIASPRSGR